MIQTGVIEDLKSLTTTERLNVIEVALRLIREDFQRAEEPPTWAERRGRLAAAAEALLPDYAAGGELSRL